MTAPAKAAPMREDVTQAVDNALEIAAKAVEGMRREIPYDHNRHPCSTTKTRAAKIVRSFIAHTARPDAGDGRLLPCPFCGTPPISVDLSDDEFGQVQCRNDGCSMAPCTDETTYVKAIAAWNTRTEHGHEWAAINRLRDEEADSVTVLCDNPEGPPNNAVECCGFWTGFADRRFEGSTIREALTAAVAAKDEASKVGYPPMSRPDAGDEDVERVARAIRVEINRQDGWSGSINEEEIARAALTAVREGVDRGMVEVPREPTEAMLCAGSTAGDDAVVNGMLQANAASASLVWTAMIEAAALSPEQPR
jgi:hypothetical protein